MSILFVSSSASYGFFVVPANCCLSYSPSAHSLCFLYLSIVAFIFGDGKQKRSFQNAHAIENVYEFMQSDSQIHLHIYNFFVYYLFVWVLIFSVLFGLTLDDGLGILVKYVWGQEGKNVASLKCFAHRFLFMHTCNVICGCSFFMHNDVND